MHTPVAADGSVFDAVTCLRAGGYWIGPKGREHKFIRYEDALVALALMRKPRWRRPNANGNWGIVLGRRWA